MPPFKPSRIILFAYEADERFDEAVVVAREFVRCLLNRVNDGADRNAWSQQALQGSGNESSPATAATAAPTTAASAPTTAASAPTTAASAATATRAAAAPRRAGADVVQRRIQW